MIDTEIKNTLKNDQILRLTECNLRKMNIHLSMVELEVVYYNSSYKINKLSFIIALGLTVNHSLQLDFFRKLLVSAASLYAEP